MVRRRSRLATSLIVLACTTRAYALDPSRTLTQYVHRIWQVQLPGGAFRVVAWAQTSEALERSASYVEGLLTGLGRTGAEQVQVEQIACETFTDVGAADLVIASTSANDVPESLFRTSASRFAERNVYSNPQKRLA